VAQAQAVAALFQKANWDWNDPLSASAFEQWRDRQVHKTDEVKAVQNPQSPSEHLTQIRTTAAEGEVEAASITLDTGDYAAVSERLEFRDREWVELSEIAELPRRAPVVRAPQRWEFRCAPPNHQAGRPHSHPGRRPRFQTSYKCCRH
jgi:hypothetical protein